ncbi:HalOD1 output domain-containing protein [Halobaculum sp. EA56]|uniref:HalOD1 output domain-containing protein n=1 Tax=Halobaculum sp. EA56 TaxID=3421648 RepID=UPI003EBA48E9
MSARDDPQAVIERTSPPRADADRPASERVVERVAAAEGSDPARLEGRLYDAVDADGLDALVDRGSSDLAVEFAFSGYTVVVEDDGPGSVSVEVTE